LGWYAASGQARPRGYAAGPMPEQSTTVPTESRAAAGYPVRVLGLRLLAALLAGLWTGLAIALLVAYRPGGPLDVLVGAGAFLPVAVAVMAIAWPPLIDEWRFAAAVAWLGIASALLVTPLLVGIIETLAAGGRQELFPSAEVAYAGILALGTTCLFGALGVVRTRFGGALTERSSLLAAGALAAVLTLVGAVAFGGAAIANELALRTRPHVTSRFGSTDNDAPPPHCTEALKLGANALIEVTARATVDGATVGNVILTGARHGGDERWTAIMQGRYAQGAASYVRVGGTAELQEGTDRWQSIAPDGFGMLGGHELTVEGPIQAEALGMLGTPVTEEVGVELIEGAQGRHCRTPLDGPTALAISLPIRWLAGHDLLDAAPKLEAWRGDLDWWVFADGELGQAVVTINGYPGDAWPSAGLQGSITARMTALDRTVTQTVGALPSIEPAP
jgi:hypothetical protein